MRGRHDESKVVYMVVVAKGKDKEEVHLEVMEVRDEGKEQRMESTGELENFPLDDEHPDQVFSMNADLDSK